MLAADAAAEAGLEVPEFSPALRARLGALVHGTTGTSNPVDAGAGVAPTELGAMLETLLASGEADAVLVVPVATGVTDGSATMAELARVRALHPEVPVVAVPLGGLPPAAKVEHPHHDLPDHCFCGPGPGPRGAVRRVAGRRAVGADSQRSEPTRSRLRAMARGLVSGHPDGRWLAPDDAAALLAGYGIPLLGRTAGSATGAAEAAAGFGFPVAIKVADPEVVHKTDRGLVRVGLRTLAEVRDAYRDFAGELGHAPQVLVQPMARGAEVALGLVRDPALGALVMVAAGGVATDVWDDRAFLVPPVARSDARRAVRSLRVWPLLDGFRGSPRGDVPGLESMIEALGRLADDLPEVAELDLNPVLVGPDGCVVVDAKVRLAAPLGPDPAAPRQLRPVH